MDIVRSMKQNFLKWRHNPRYWLVMGIVFLLLIDVMRAFREVSLQSGKNLSPWLLPFFVRDHYILLYIALCLILLFCDAPFLDNLHFYNICRTGRSRWIMGQFLYILCCSAVFFACMEIVMVLLCLDCISFTGDWGNCFRMLAYDNPFWGEFCSEMILNNSAWVIMIKTYLICWLTGCFIGVLLLCLNLTVGREAGAVITAMVAAIDFYIFAGAFQSASLFWFSPISWMNPEQYLGTEAWKYPVRIMILIFLICILFFLSRRKVMKMHITTLPEI